MKTIELSQGQVALVDDADFDELSKHKWSAAWSKNKRRIYAQRNGDVVNTEGQRKRRTILMHRAILGLEFGDRRKGYHRDHAQTLNNQRANLRIAAHQQKNRKRLKTSSGIKGVYPLPSGNYTARIYISGRLLTLGIRSTKEAAHALYVEAVRELRGEFARCA